MGEKEYKRSSSGTLPFGLGPSIKITEIEDKEGRKGRGVGWTRDVADERAEEDYEDDDDE